MINLDVEHAPCTAASFSYLAAKDFFGNSSCSHISATLETIQCGDPKSDGSGGPAYQFGDENVPSGPVTAAPSASASASPEPTADPNNPTFYTAGQVIMVNTGANTNGSQFMIVYGNTSPISNAHTVVGSVVSGMDIIDKVAKDGAVDQNGKAAAEGKPKTQLTFLSVTVTAPGATPTGSPSPTSAPTTPASTPAQS